MKGDEAMTTEDVITANAQLCVVSFHDSTRAHALLSVCRAMTDEQMKDSLEQIVRACLAEAAKRDLKINVEL